MLFGRKVNLDEVAIAAPCPIKWAKMDGDETVRFCSHCELNVYNISKMTRKEAQSFMESHSGRLCLRLFRRQDGTLITKDCPIGRRIVDSVKRRTRAIATAFVALMNANAVFGQQQNVNQPKEVGKVQNPAGMSFIQWDGIPVDPRHYTVNSQADLKKTTSTISDEHPTADTTAMDAFMAAQSFEASREPAQAVLCYENAIKVFRSSEIAFDEKFKQRVAKAYARLLRKQHNSELAKLIEKEFCNRK